MNSYYDEYTGYQAMLSSSMEIHLYRNKDMAPLEEHCHDFYEMFFLADGNVTFLIDEEEYVMNREDILLLPPGIFHREIPGPGYYERIILRLNPWYLTRLSTRKTNLASCFVFSEEKGYLLKAEPFERNRIRAVLYVLLQETKGNDFGKDILIESELKRLLIMMNRCQSLNIPAQKADTQEGGKNMQEILRYINQHYTENITLDLLCEKFYISKFYLSRSFERLTGQSIYKYILEKRMIMARQLLLFGERPTEIYTLCGFTNYSNFYRAFKKYYEMSPSQFLKNITSMEQMT